MWTRKFLNITLFFPESNFYLWWKMKAYMFSLLRKPKESIRSFLFLLFSLYTSPSKSFCMGLMYPTHANLECTRWLTRPLNSLVLLLPPQKCWDFMCVPPGLLWWGAGDPAWTPNLIFVDVFIVSLKLKFLPTPCCLLL